jgi:hypothetical protein
MADLKVTEFTVQTLEVLLKRLDRYVKTKRVKALIDKRLVPVLSRHEKTANENAVLQRISALMKIPPFAVFLVSVLAFISMVKKNVKNPARFFSSFAGGLLPLIYTFKTIESPQENDNQRLLTYCTD